jgi:predicted secreted hydrolase
LRFAGLHAISHCVRRITRLILGAMLLLAGRDALGSAGAPASTTAFETARSGYLYAFPRDHGSHDTFRTEWWYYTGHLAAEDGHRFGYQLTFFRRGIEDDRVRANPSRWAIRQLYLAHAAISDLSERRFQYAEKVSRAGLGKAGAAPDRLRVWIDRWAADSAEPDDPRHHLQAAADGFSMDLMLAPEKAPVVHGEQGISLKGGGAGQASHYYSLTRLAASGAVAIGSRRFTVTGSGWMDHEFGSADLGESLIGWDWFGIQLDDRTELMLYRLRHPDGRPDPLSSGTIVLPDGRTRHLRLPDFTVDVLDRWHSPASGAEYPSRWRIAVPSERLKLEVTPLLADQELLTRRSTQVTYWEGAVAVRGNREEAPVTGQGFVELTGYAERFRQKL